MNGWGQVFLSVAPDGTALPCQAARMLPGLDFPKVTEHPLAWIWNESPAFNRYRGRDWMKEPCRSCPERDKDFGGCRCQAWLITGDPDTADPVCGLSPHRDLVDRVVEAVNDGTAGAVDSGGSDSGTVNAAGGTAAPGGAVSPGDIPAMLFRNPRNSKGAASLTGGLARPGNVRGIAGADARDAGCGAGTSRNRDRAAAPRRHHPSSTIPS